MPIVDRPVEDEPEEKPDQLGRALIRVRREFPGQWREVFETTNRSHAVRIEGCLIGRGEGRIAGASDIDHWEARLVERAEKDQTVYAVRVRWHEKPHGKDWRRKSKEPKAEPEGEPLSVTGREVAAESAAADHPETERVNGGGRAKVTQGASGNTETIKIPRDPEEAAQAGLDLAAG